MKYVEGVTELDRKSRSRYGAEFALLTAEQQDQILADMERATLQTEAALEAGEATAGFAPVEPALQQTSVEIELEFFPLLAMHTRQGFYADPIYGGNKNRVGWKLSGFEGPESLAETHAGRFTTLPFFAEEQIDWNVRKSHGTQT
jgi:gluconate 2-dehydrogenase gamma chain